MQEIWQADTHHPHQSVNIYDYVELLVRVAHGRYPEIPSIALRLRIMLERDLGPRWPAGLDTTAKDAIETNHKSIYDLFYASAIAQGQKPDEAKETADADMVTKAGGVSALAKVQSKGKKKGGAMQIPSRTLTMRRSYTGDQMSRSGLRNGQSVGGKSFISWQGQPEMI